MAEKSVQAYFHSLAEAQRIVAKLQALRVLDVQINDVQINQADATQLSTLGVKAAIPSAEHTETNGLSAALFESGNSGYNGGEGADTLLTAIVDAANYEQALRVVRDGGGIVYG